ncbi:DNA-directed DNA polymerase [Melia azedarach]|uniref:DNA-directed DNA polymerase n=1 Tax=Melia azedarach TaxID=155640 RepID=A0ACC1X5E9_MELAZ|nr:DNA-directed DNA polymerase [Melia azedarach]
MPVMGCMQRPEIGQSFNHSLSDADDVIKNQVNVITQMEEQTDLIVSNSDDELPIKEDDGGDDKMSDYESGNNSDVLFDSDDENQDLDLYPIDPEIECTFRRRRREQRVQAEFIEMADDAGVVNGQNAVVIADDRDRAIREYAVPIFNELNPGIVRPEIQAPQFELKPVMFQMLQTVGQFSGMPTEDPYLHLRLFIEVSDSFKLPGVTENALRLKLFTYSLRDRARAWLNSLPSDLVTTWQELAEKFLIKYFPPTKNAKLRNKITAFQQVDEESLYEAWEHFKELLRKCPHNGIPHCIQIETFYNGLNVHTRMVVDASSNGAILAKSYNEAYEILERISNNNYQWPTTRASTGRKVAGIHEVDALTSLAAQVSSMSSMIKTISMGMGSQIGQLAEVSCVYCGDDHAYENCPSNPASHMESKKWEGNLPPIVKRKIVKMREKARDMNAVFGERDLYKALVDNSDSYVVNLAIKECDCGEWQIPGFPRVHVIKCIDIVRADVKRIGDVFGEGSKEK